MEQNVKSKLPIIRCPHCGREYLADEIFMPGDLIGKSSAVIRDALGKIIYDEYEEEPELTQRFECDGCGKPFVVEAQVTFRVKKEAEELDFSEPFVSLLD